MLYSLSFFFYSNLEDDLAQEMADKCDNGNVGFCKKHVTVNKEKEGSGDWKQNESERRRGGVRR